MISIPGLRAPAESLGSFTYNITNTVVGVDGQVRAHSVLGSDGPVDRTRGAIKLLIGNEELVGVVDLDKHLGCVSILHPDVDAAPTAGEALLLGHGGDISRRGSQGRAGKGDEGDEDGRELHFD